MKLILVSRHLSLLYYLREMIDSGEEIEVKMHVSASDVAGKHVIGNVPLNIASAALSVTVIPLSPPKHLRGAELSLAQVKKYSHAPETYVVHRTASPLEANNND